MRLALHLRRPATLTALAALPTVWSNALTAWWLAEGTQVERLSDLWPDLNAARAVLVLLGLSTTWIGWAIAEGTRAGEDPAKVKSIALLLPGTIILAASGQSAALLALSLGMTLAGLLVLPSASVFAPVFRGLARLVLYLAAATVATDGVNGWSIWGGLVVGCFVAGSACFERQQQLGLPADWLPVPLLAAPLVLAWTLNNGPWRGPALLLGAVLALWLARALRRLFWPGPKPVPGVAADFVPAIVLVDWLAMCDAPRNSALLFVPLFLLAATLHHQLARRAVA